MAKVSNKQIPVNFNDVRSGNRNFKPLVNKDTQQPLKDIDYFELLGRWGIEQDNNNTSKLPTDYGTFDRATVEFAKTIAKALDEGQSRSDVAKYIQLSVDITQ